MRIVRQAELTPVPWKNGGGVTREVIRVPPAGDPFRWRVSIARIDTAGPFSDFADYRRYMVLLEGAGVRLSFAGAGAAAPTSRELRGMGDQVQFDGAVATRCELIDGACVDFNLMVAKALPDPALRVVAPSALRDASIASGESLLVFPLDARIGLNAAGVAEMLHPWDLALIGAKELRGLRVAASHPADATPPRLVLATVPSD